MKERNKTKEQLTAELREMRRKKEALKRARLKGRETEKALREGEKRFRTLSEATDAMIFILQGTRYIYVNPAGEIERS